MDSLQKCHISKSGYQMYINPFAAVSNPVKLCFNDKLQASRYKKDTNFLLTFHTYP